MTRAQHAWIAVPEVGSIPALVELDATSHATAVLLVHPLRALDDVVGTQVGIDVTTTRGVVHVDARVAAVRDGEVLDLEVAGDRELIQRREYVRVDAVLDVAVASAGEPDGRTAIAVNISGSGAVVSQLEGLAPGDPVDLWLRLAAAEPPVMVSGRIVRETDQHLLAVHFEQLATADRERIVHYVFARQRLELQRMKRA
ncbi:MAG TPA: PilZ domain-containing protein [Solirubrobacteraceae bacterium]|nr:PilZ domain-containing protein [Solirubrobacteraceae bacterium]